MRTTLASLIGTLGLAAASAVAQQDQALINQTAAERRGPAPAAAPAARGPQAPVVAPTDDLAGQEVEALADLKLAQARVALVEARKALREDRFRDAALGARQAQALLRDLPPDRDVSVFDLQAEGILARAARAGVNLNELPPPGPAAAGAESGSRPALPPEPPTPTQRLIEYNRRSVAEQARIDAAATMSDLRALRDADASRIAPPGDVTYPPYWPALTARRAAFAGGMIWRGPSYLGQDGKERFAALYDVNDLIYNVPDFYLPYGLQPLVDSFFTAGDRAALQLRSGIFSGDASDLAAGLPLLDIMGGIGNPWVARGPKFSPQRLQQLSDLVEALTARPDEAKVVPVQAPN